MSPQGFWVLGSLDLVCPLVKPKSSQASKYNLACTKISIFWSKSCKCCTFDRAKLYMGLCCLFFLLLCTVSDPIESTLVLKKNCLSIPEGWCGLSLSGKSPLELEAKLSSIRARNEVG